MKSEKGVTLIALVITIIVLIILAAVSISTLMGDSGILTEAQNAENMSGQGEIVDEMTAELTAFKTEILADGKISENTFTTTCTRLTAKGYTLSITTYANLYPATDAPASLSITKDEMTGTINLTTGQITLPNVVRPT